MTTEACRILLALRTVREEKKRSRGKNVSGTIPCLPFLDRGSVGAGEGVRTAALKRAVARSPGTGNESMAASANRWAGQPAPSAARRMPNRSGMKVAEHVRVQIEKMQNGAGHTAWLAALRE
jgi:hypothetical protein